MVEGDTVKRCKHKVRPAVCFGLGMLVATALPTKWVLVVAAAALVIVSFLCVRR